MYALHILHDTFIKHGSLLKGCINYMLWVLIFVNGGQGGDINAPGDTWVLRLGLGIPQWFGSFATWLRELYLCVVWWRKDLKVF